MRPYNEKAKMSTRLNVNVDISSNESYQLNKKGRR